MRRHVLFLAIAAMGVQAAHAAVVCEPGPDGRMIAVSPPDAAPPTAAQQQRCANGKAAQTPIADNHTTDQSTALSKAATALAEAAKVLQRDADSKWRAPQNKPVTPIQTWTFQKGESIDQGLQRWAKQASWTVIWNLPQDWVVPNGVEFHGDFSSAVGAVVNSLSSNGANIQSDIYQGNKTIVIHEMGDKK